MSVSSKASTWTSTQHNSLISSVALLQSRSHVFSRLLKQRSAVELDCHWIHQQYFRTWKRSCTAVCKFRIIWIASGLARKYQWYISTIYIMIVWCYFQVKISWYFWYFQNTNIYYYLITFLIHAYLTQTAQVLMLLNDAKKLLNTGGV